MEEKRSFSRRIESFLGGKGFYIVLFACAAVIGVSAWLIFNRPAAEEDYEEVLAGVSEITTVQAPAGPNFGELFEQDAPASVKPEVRPDKTAAEPAEEEPTEEAQAVLNPVEVPIEEPPAPAPQPEAEPEEKTTEQLTFIWPVSGNLAVGYSPDALVFDKTMGDWRTHEGVDIEAQLGTRVMAVAAGTVMSVMSEDMYGTVVTIDHGDGLTSVYANLAGTPTVKAGDNVTMGAVIGAVGDTALAEAGEVSHLHFAMEKDGEPLDPSEYLPRR